MAVLALILAGPDTLKRLRPVGVSLAEESLRMPHAWVLRVLILLALIVLLLGTAAIFYYYIEEPANRKLRKWMRTPLPKPALGNAVPWAGDREK